MDEIEKAVNLRGTNAFEAVAGNSDLGIRMAIPTIVAPENAPIATSDTYVAVAPTTILINSNGPFIRRIAVGNAKLPPLKNYNPGSLRSKVLQLLHEAGHLTVINTSLTVRTVRVGTVKEVFLICGYWNYSCRLTAAILP